MKSISGSILILAAAIVWQPAVEIPNRMEFAWAFAVPLLLAGVILLIAGLKTKS